MGAAPSLPTRSLIGQTPGWEVLTSSCISGNSPTPGKICPVLGKVSYLEAFSRGLITL